MNLKNDACENQPGRTVGVCAPIVQGKSSHIGIDIGIGSYLSYVYVYKCYWQLCRQANKVFVKPLLLSAIPLHCSAAKMTSFPETTRTLRYELWSREIYIEEPITSPETLLEHPQTQNESINTIQEIPNSQFRLVLSVTLCMPRTSSLESISQSPSHLLFSPTPSQRMSLPLTPPRTSYLPLHLAPITV